jgi:hypothetical protein
MLFADDNVDDADDANNVDDDVDDANDAKANDD